MCTNSCDSAPSIVSACKLHIRSTQYLFTLMQSLEHLNAVRSSWSGSDSNWLEFCHLCCCCRFPQYYLNWYDTFGVDQGISSVRAFGTEKRMCDQFMAMIDANHRAYVLFVHAARWFGVRLDFAAASCVALAALLVVLLRHSLSSGLAGTLLISFPLLKIPEYNTYVWSCWSIADGARTAILLWDNSNTITISGVVLVQSLQLTGFFQYGVRLAADTENYFTSVERIQVLTWNLSALERTRHWTPFNRIRTNL